MGIVMSNKKLLEIEKRLGFYAMEYTSNSFIFPNKRKKGIHLFNHSCSSNCCAQSYEGHCLFFAQRKIFKGEELTIDYEIPPPQKDDKSHPCFCDSLFCRGTMHLPEGKINGKTKSTEEKKFFNKNKTEVSFGEYLPPLKKYPTIIEDKPGYNLYANLDKAPLVHNDKKLPNLKKIRKHLRETGLGLKFKNINITIYGINNGMIIAKIEN